MTGLPSFSSSGTFGGGGGGGVPSICSSTHRPRFTGDVRVGLDVTVSTLACVSTPPRLVAGVSSTRTNSSSLAGRPRLRARPFRPCRDAVVPRQRLVQVREVGIDHVEDAAVFADDLAEEQLRLL